MAAEAALRSLLVRTQEMLGRCVRRRDAQWDEMPVLWPSPKRFDASVVSRVQRNGDTWVGELSGAEHQFIAWEMAVRHVAACYETYFHYLRICDGVEEEECERRVARIAELADTIERLRGAERILRPLLPDRAPSRGVMADCPWPDLYETPGELPPDPQMEALAVVWLGDVAPRMREAVAVLRRGEPFAGKAFDILAEADSEIPGPGMHTAVWDSEKRRYLYPFDHEFEGILRGLRYIPAYLARAWEQPEFARSVVQTAGGCLEGCVKDMFRTGPRRHVYSHRPLGSLARTAHAKKTLGAELAGAIVEFADAAANPAKHDYQTGRGARPRFSFDDAVSAYFLARVLGAAVLGATGRIGPLETATHRAAERAEFFRGASLSL